MKKYHPTFTRLYEQFVRREKYPYFRENRTAKKEIVIIQFEIIFLSLN